jgi:outer membrane protein assembly factor BamD (BamD/ComL family)
VFALRFSVSYQLKMYRLYSLILVVLVLSCSQYSTKKSSIRWHNFNARYNAYIQARENLKEAEKVITSLQKDDYSQQLNVVFPLDSTLASGQSAELEAVIKKASMIAQNHQNSKLIGKAYNLIGRARFLKGDLINAIETFKFVNSESNIDNEKHEAMVHLMGCYLALGDNATVLRVAEVLAQQNLNKENTIGFYLNKAQAHQNLLELKTTVAIVEEALPLMKKSPKKARLHFVAGQLYEELKDPRSVRNYKAVANNKPSYDLKFYSEINQMSQVGSVDLQRSFSKMINDRKNEDLQDKLYYTKALLDEKSGDMKEATSNLVKATQVKLPNPIVKASAFMKLGDINYYRNQNYTLAKSYYDSSLTLMAPNSKFYDILKRRKAALDDFNTQTTTVAREDSLQRMAGMQADDLDQYLDKEIKASLDREAKALADAKKAQEAALRAQANAAKVGNSLVDNSKPRWYFYSEEQKQQGKLDFNQRWGQRKLEDHWRRATKSISFTDASASTNGAQAMDDSTASDEELPDIDRISEIKGQILKAIPSSDSALAVSNQTKALAYFNLGKIYKDNLLEETKSIDAYKKFIDLAPNAEQAPEAMYALALLNLSNAGEHAYWKNRLFTEFPDAFFTRKLQKGTEGLDKNEESAASKSYQKAYQLYQEGNTSKCLQLIEQNLKEYPGSDIEDKLSFLKIMALSKTGNKANYEQALDYFMKNYPSSSLQSLAQEMKTFLESQLDPKLPDTGQNPN